MNRYSILFFCLVLIGSNLQAQYDPFESLGDSGFGYFNKDNISAELDNNGENEILISDHGNWVLWRKAPNMNNHILVAEYSCGYEASHVKTVVRDLDGDGLKDIVMAFIIHRDSSAGTLSRISLNQNPVVASDSGPAPGPIPPPPPPLPFFAQGIVQVHRNLGNMEFAPPKRLAQNLGYLMDMQVGNLDSSDELEVITSSVNADSIADFYIKSNGCVGNYNGFTEGMYILSGHTYMDTIESVRTLVINNTININQIELTDYDDDGDQDLIVASLSSGMLGIYNNENNLNFVLLDSLQINPGRIVNMEMVDLNNDGHDDLVYSGALNSSTSHISIAYFENNQFSFPHLMIDSSTSPKNYQLNFFDVNGNGLKDFIFRPGYLKEWNFKANLGDGVFSADSTYLCDLVEYSILEHNADNNGMLDILQIGYASNFWNYNVQTVYCFFNINQSSSLVYDLVSPQEFIRPYQMISADLNQDGIEEIVTVSPVCPTINAVNVNIENELLRNQHLILDESGGRSVISGDWDMDGDPDLAYISEGSPQFGLKLAFQVAPNVFQDSLLSGSVNSWSPWLLKSDFDQDGDLDIIEYLGQASNKPFLWIFRNDGAGSFSPKEALSDTVYYLSGSVKMIDWNNDNYDDFIYTSPSQIIYYENIGGVTLAEPDTLVSSCGSCDGFYVTDTDNNGLTDIIYRSNTANGIVILKKIDGSAPFVSDTVAVEAGLSGNFVFDDLNADGVKDIISAVNDSLQIRVYLMGPAQTGSPLIAHTYLASITSLGLADLNQDGLNDLFGRYTNGHKIFWAFRDPGNPLQFIPQQMTGEVQVFPNPGAGLLNIRCASDNLIDKVEIFSLDGKLCAQHQINPACDVQLEAPESNGVYLIRAYTQTGIHTTRFMCAGN